MDAKHVSKKQVRFDTEYKPPVVILCVMLFLGSILSATSITAADTKELPELDCVIEPSEVADLGSAVPGVIGKIHAKRSDMVKKGDIVAELEATVERANVKLSKARAELETSVNLREESAAFGRRTAERNQTLFQKESISKQDIDKLDTENRIAQLQVHQEHDNKKIASLEYKRAVAVLDRHLIRMPFDGVVMERFKSIGEYIEDDPVVRIAQLDPLHVEVLLPVVYMGMLAPGRRAEVTPNLRGSVSKIATVTRVDQVADAASDTFGARLTLANPNYAIPAGLRCRLAFLPPEEHAEPLADDETVLASPYNTAEDETVTESPFNTAEDETVTESPFNTAEDETVTESPFNTAEDEPLAYVTDSTAPETVALQQNTASDTSAPAVTALTGEEVAAPYKSPDVESAPIAALDELAEDVVAPEIETASIMSDSTDTFRDTGYTNECYRIGPLPNKTLASELSGTLTTMDSTSQPTLDLVNGGRRTEYRVLATSQPDLVAPDDMEGYLANKGVKDTYTFNYGEYKGRTSVGVYGDVLNALSREESLRAIGVEVEILEINRELSNYWINLSFNSSPKSQVELQSVAIRLAPEAIVQPVQCSQQQVTRTE
jgi:RND family efflux transporter MFP subunit